MGKRRNNRKSKVDNTTSDGSGKDITKELEVNPDDVELFEVEDLVPTGAPITVPYLEIFRTDELEYIPYMSPYNVGVTSSSSSDTSSSASSTSTDPNASTDPNNPNSQSGSQTGSDSSSGSSSSSSSGSSSS